MVATLGDAKLNKLGMSGDYNKNSAPQRMALSHTFSVLEQAVSKVCEKNTFTSRDTFTVADYGSSHGGNSLEPMTIIIEAVRKHASRRQAIAVYHTDLPQNDYNALFRTLHDNDDSYMTLSTKESTVMSFATATPFFQQILPASSVHFGFSASAVHWLSCFPSDASCLYTCAAPESERAPWKDQAASDWNRFLDAREIELAPGGVMVLANLFMEDNGNYTTRELGLAMDDIIREMVDNGMVDASAARRFTHPSYFRTLQEYSTGIREHNMTLRTSFSRQIENPLYQEYKESGNWTAYGEAMAAWAKQWAHVALLRVVSYMNMDQAAEKAACDFFYKRVAEKVAENPHDHQIVMVMLYLVIEKNIVPVDAQN